MRAGEGTRETVLEVASRVTRVPRAALRPEMDLAADLGIDSPKALELLAALEEKLAIEISDEDAARMETLGDILEHVARLEGRTSD